MNIINMNFTLPSRYETNAQILQDFNTQVANFDIIKATQHLLVDRALIFIGLTVIITFIKYVKKREYTLIDFLYVNSIFATGFIILNMKIHFINELNPLSLFFLFLIIPMMFIYLICFVNTASHLYDHIYSKLEDK